MSFSYTLPPASDSDRVRFLIADTEEDGYKVEDEEIVMCLDQTGQDPFFAGAMVCEHLSAKYSSKGRKSVGALTIEYSQMAGDYQSRASALTNLGYNRPGTAGGPYVGGISKSDKDARSQDLDWVRTLVSIGFTDIRGSTYVNDYAWNER